MRICIRHDSQKHVRHIAFLFPFSLFQFWLLFCSPSVFMLGTSQKAPKEKKKEGKRIQHKKFNPGT